MQVILTDSITGLREEKTEGASFPSHSMLPMFEGFKPTPLQKPFQPGSSPEHLSSRYMVGENLKICKIALAIYFCIS